MASLGLDSSFLSERFRNDSVRVTYLSQKLLESVRSNVPVRKIQQLGSSDGSTTYGTSLDRGDLEIDGVLDELENGEEVRTSIHRKGPGRYELVILGVEDQAAPPAD